MKLIKLAQNCYRLEVENVSHEGSLPEIAEVMRARYDVPQGDIDQAVLEILRTQHDTAEFSNLMSFMRGLKGYRFVRTLNGARERLLLVQLRAIQELQNEIVSKRQEDGYNSPRVLDLLDRLGRIQDELSIEGLISVVESKLGRVA